DPYFAIGADVLSARRIGSPLAENIELGAQCFTTMQTPSGNFLVSCGNWENSFQLISLNDGRLVQSVRQHKDVVSCVYGISSAHANSNLDISSSVSPLLILDWQKMLPSGHTLVRGDNKCFPFQFILKSIMRFPVQLHQMGARLLLVAMIQQL
ncbi:hypothetical protein Tco_0020702, partial [Tanacetum coccineum]